jgi:hypothetical protein
MFLFNLNFTIGLRIERSSVSSVFRLREPDLKFKICELNQRIHFIRHFEMALRMAPYAVYFSLAALANLFDKH